MQGTIQKWGNSLAVRLPRLIAEGAKLSDGATVELEVEGSALIIRATRKRYRLADLLAQDQAKHDEVDWGAPQGAEVW